MKHFLSDITGSKEFKEKPIALKKLINEALFIIESLGIPLADIAPRRLEKMALTFLAVLDVNPQAQWKNVKDITTPRSMKTRELIQYINDNFGEAISMGSYDDIRRKDLYFVVLANIIVQTHPNAAMNDSTRGYALNPEYTELIREFGSDTWDEHAKEFMKQRKTLDSELLQARELTKVPIILPNGVELLLSEGEHNILQKNIVEDFLPRYGYGAEVLYIGDTADKFLHKDEEKLKAIKFFELFHGDLPDIIAYSKEKNWLYLVEAVYSSGAISQARMLELKRLTKDCTAEIIYITAFLDRDTFRKFIKDIAWESEVWIAKDPDHLIHFNGNKFLGPYKK